MSPMRVAAAPISWGVCEVPGWGVQLERDVVLGQMVELNFAATELGPAGFLPTDANALQAVLAQSGLALAGAFVAPVLHDPAQRLAALAEVDAAATLLAEVGLDAPVVLACATGTGGYETAGALDDAGWSLLAEGVSEVVARCAYHGVGCVLHPHVGTMIETAADVDRIMAATEIALCLDTGHLLAAGADPLAVLGTHVARVRHVHLKDVDASLAAQVREGKLAYAEAVSAGMYVPLGTGDVPISDVLATLEHADYRDWVVVEQDLRLDAADGAAERAREGAAHARTFLTAHEVSRGREVAS